MALREEWARSQYSSHDGAARTSWGTARPQNARFLRDLGCDSVIDYTTVRYEDVVGDLDVVLDTVGGDTLDRSWRLLRPGGALITIAGSAPADTAAEYGVRGIEFIVRPSRAQLMELGRLLEAEEIRPIVEAIFPLERAPEAFERGLRGHNRGKLVLEIGGGETEQIPLNKAEPEVMQPQWNGARIAMVGAGPVGGYFGGMLAHAGENIVFVERGSTFRALRESGLQVESPDGNFVVRPTAATDDSKSVGTVDVVLVAVKGWQVPAAIETIRPLVGPDTLIMPLMDGIEAPEQLATAFGKEHVVAGLAIMLGRSVAPGHIRNKLSHSSITIGELDGQTTDRILRLQRVFQRAGINATVSTNILRARWEKLVLVGPWSAVGAVTRAPLGIVRALPETRELLEKSMREVLTVARAFGTALSDEVVQRSLQSLDRAPEAAIGNMRDIIDGRPSELEIEVGAIVRLARRLGVETPFHSFLYASLLPQERRARGDIEFPFEDESSTSAA